jgi:hypothetical protein
MENIDPWKREARQLTRTMFTAQHLTPALVLRWVAEGELGKNSGPQTTHLHSTRLGLAERIEAGSTVPDRRPVRRERLIVVRTKLLAKPDEYSVGRQQSCDMFVNDYTVSARHGTLHWMKRIQRWMFKDLDSTNGSWINGEPLPPQQRSLLRSTDELQLGRMCFLFLEADDLHRYLVGDY